MLEQLYCIDYWSAKSICYATKQYSYFVDLSLYNEHTLANYSYEFEQQHNFI